MPDSVILGVGRQGELVIRNEDLRRLRWRA